MGGKDGLLPDDPKIGCGYGFFKTNNLEDPFFTPCAYHDFAYGHKENFDSRKQVDDMLLSRCLRIAGSNLFLKAKAYTYYSLARLFGGFVW